MELVELRRGRDNLFTEGTVNARTDSRIDACFETPINEKSTCAITSDRAAESNFMD